MIATGRARRRRRDEVAVEEPLEIRVDGEPLAVTMRTPGPRRGAGARLPLRRGADRPRARGRADRRTSRPTSSRSPGRCCATPGARRFYTTLLVRGLRQGRAGGGRGARAAGRRPGPSVPRALLADAARARCAQPAFARTGGLHATGLFDAGGELLIVREDVGRHNAMDKVIGRALLDGAASRCADRVLCVSGRLSFELVQKAAVAGRPDPRRRRRADLAGDRAGARAAA